MQLSISHSRPLNSLQPPSFLENERREREMERVMEFLCSRYCCIPAIVFTDVVMLFVIMVASYCLLEVKFSHAYFPIDILPDRRSLFFPFFLRSAKLYFMLCYSVCLPVIFGRIHCDTREKVPMSMPFSSCMWKDEGFWIKFQATLTVP